MILLEFIRARRAELRREDVRLLSNAELWDEIIAGIRELALLPDDIVDRLEQAELSESGEGAEGPAPSPALPPPDDDFARMSDEELWRYVVKKTRELVDNRLVGPGRARTYR